jgi:hypothetical protein
LPTALLNDIYENVTLQDICALDSALCSKAERPDFLDTLVLAGPLTCHYNFEPKDLDDLPRLLAWLKKRSLQLRTINATSGLLSDALVCEILGIFRSVNRLSISCQGISTSSLAAVLQECKNSLHELKLDGVSEYEYVMEALETCENLRSLTVDDVEEWPFYPVSSAMELASLRSVKHFAISTADGLIAKEAIGHFSCLASCHITSDFSMYNTRGRDLASITGPHMKRISLVQIGDEFGYLWGSHDTLVTHIVRTCANIEELEVDGLDISDRTLRTLTKHAAALTSLKRLRIRVFHARQSVTEAFRKCFPSAEILHGMRGESEEAAQYNGLMRYMSYHIHEHDLDGATIEDFVEPDDEMLDDIEGTWGRLYRTDES